LLRDTREIHGLVGVIASLRESAGVAVEVAQLDDGALMFVAIAIAVVAAAVVAVVVIVVVVLLVLLVEEVHSRVR
jgi:hypothetical protein